ncbi:DUF1552 domain-containing protein [Lentisphaera profundi]|uniref:DUF1552 domain-containing protein n=1 Tax=Lentisphaera profundi TaxID=1658616 RepID=A0ABY7VYR0_9BACT|nr:DUF1552 domain-containing protein [Lentisphaera profundi]WDE99242.1 DUF1552 domain-containing protein [Lentisphaera profundi]
MSYKISRRSFLSGVGVAMPLPYLNLMAKNSKAPKAQKRFLALFKPNGVHPPTWAIQNGKEKQFDLSALMRPLQPYKNDLLILDNIGNKHQASHHGYNFLCGNQRPKEASLDQVIAKEIGNDTNVRSLELTTEGIFTNQPDCSYISYDDKGRYVPRESDPQLVFDKLFRSPLNNVKRRQEMTSILDGVKDNASFLKRRVGKEDQETLDEYYTIIRETEIKLANSKKNKAIDSSSFIRPQASTNLDEQVTAMMDIMALALWTDTTRVSTYMLGNDNSRLIFDFLGIQEQHHWLSHFFRNFSIGNITKLNKINYWHLQKFAYMMSRLQGLKDGNGTLLDNTLIYFGSGMGHSDTHAGSRIPAVLAGGKNIVKTGRYINHAQGQDPRALHMAIMQQYGIKRDSYQGYSQSMTGLNDSNYDHFVTKQIDTFIKEENGTIKIQGTLQQSPNIDTPRLHTMKVANAKSVKIEVSFGNFNKVNLAYYCTRNVYIEAKGKLDKGHWMITEVTKIEELK